MVVVEEAEVEVLEMLLSVIWGEVPFLSEVGVEEVVELAVTEKPCVSCVEASSATLSHTICARPIRAVASTLEAKATTVEETSVVGGQATVGMGASAAARGISCVTSAATDTSRRRGR